MGVKVDFKVNVPHGEMDITQNGQYDVSDCAIANVNVAFETEEKNVTITENGTQEVLPSVGKDALSKVVINTEIPIKEEQSKNIEIKENGTISLLPDEGKVLNEVSITTNVPQSGVPEKGIIFSDYDSDGYPHTITIKQLSLIHYMLAQANIYISDSNNRILGRVEKVNIENKGLFEGFPENFFESLISLKTINILMDYSDSVYYKDTAFSNTGIKNIIFKNIQSDNNFGKNICNRCIKLTNVTFENCNNIKNIKYQAFNNCSSLTNITIPNTVTTIDTYAFYGCNNLINLTIPENVTTIGGYGLYIGTRTNKTTIIFKPITPPSIQTSTFNNSALNKIYVPSASLEAYKTATNWVAFADYIEADPNE